jgi:L-fucose dehydrogenase
MNLNLDGKIIIVTGGSSGIGAAVVSALLDEAAVPVVLDRQKPGADCLARIGAAGGDWIDIDLTDERRCRAVVDAVRSRWGRIDGLVNNAGGNDKLGLSAPPDAFRASLERNLVQVYVMAHLCLSDLRRSKGSIVNVASKVALTGQGGTSAYAAAKGGVLALTREWAADLAGDGIRVNAVVPAEVMTPHYDAFIQGCPDPAAKLAEIEGTIPLGRRMTTPSEIAATVVFALSDKASHTTGQWLFVDGGYTHLDRALTVME